MTKLHKNITNDARYSKIVTGVNNVSANYATVAADSNKVVVSTNSAITITIANVLAAGERIDFVQTGTGQVTFTAGSGVTLTSAGGKLKTNVRYSSATVLCVASGSYVLIGDLAA